MTVPYPWRRILVPTDFSTCSDTALALATLLAQDHGAEVVLLHVVCLTDLSPDVRIHPPSHPEGISVGDHARVEARRRLDPRLERVPRGVSARAEIVFGKAEHAILKAIDTLAPDVLVMGTHGRSGFTHLFLGSVAERVLRKSRVPVVTVREASCSEAPVDAELGDEREG